MTREPPAVVSERRYQRASASFPAEFVWGTITQPAVALMIGLGGCFLETEVIVPPGEELDLHLRLEPSGGKIKCRGKVAWIAYRKGYPTRAGKKSRGFALEFMRIFPEDRARIEEYVVKRNRLFRAMDHELKKQKPDQRLIKELFSAACPGESTHLAHVRKVCRYEVQHFRLRR